MTGAALETRALCKNFGALVVANDINFRLEKGARHALIGPNGAGKTTFINLITGALAPSSGTVLFDDNDVTRLDQASRVKRGLARTFQINQLFPGLTVLENVCMSVSERQGVRRSLFRPMAGHREVVDEAWGLLEALKLQDDAGRSVRELAYGRQRLVEIAIALGLEPRVLLLDEPMAGVPSSETNVLLDVIEGLSSDISILIIEHDMDVVFRFAERITVLVQGEVLTEGSPDEISSDERVRSVYLGEGAHG